MLLSAVSPGNLIGEVSVWWRALPTARRGIRVGMFFVRLPVFSIVLKGEASWEEVPLGERRQGKYERDPDVRIRSACMLSTSRRVNKE